MGRISYQRSVWRRRRPCHRRVLALPSAANTVNQTGWLNDRPPPNAPRGPRGDLQRPIPHPPNVPRPAPNVSAAASRSEGYASHTRWPVLTPPTHLTGQNGRSMQKGEAPVRFGQASLGSAPRALPSTPASVSYVQRAPDTIHPSRRPFIDTTGTYNAVAQNRTFAQTHPDRARLLEAPKDHWPIPESGPPQAPKSMSILSGVLRNSESPSRSDVGRAGQYTPTPGPSSRSNSSSAKSTLNARSSYRDATKTPGLTKGQKQVASSELGSPSLHSNGKSLPATASRPSVAPLSARAAGKQPVRSDVPPVNASSPSASRAKTKGNGRQCRKCPKSHRGKCPPLCSMCSERHKGACRGVCSACNKRHNGICRVRSRALAKDHSSPRATVKQGQAPKGAEQSGAISPSAPQTPSNTRSVEAADNEILLCKHRRNNEKCVSCECGCGKCHRPGKLCKTQLAESRKKASKQTKDQKKAARQTKSQKKASKKRKADDADDADGTNVKVEESASRSMPLSQPKKKRKKETKAKTKTKEKREGPVDSRGQWYNPIPVPD